MTTVVDTPTSVIEALGDGFRQARQGLHDLKTHVMGVEDRLTERLKRIEAKIDRLSDGS